MSSSSSTDRRARLSKTRSGDHDEVEGFTGRRTISDPALVTTMRMGERPTMVDRDPDELHFYFDDPRHHWRMRPSAELLAFSTVSGRDALSKMDGLNIWFRSPCVENPCHRDPPQDLLSPGAPPLSPGQHFVLRGTVSCYPLIGGVHH